jgi:hypothetical protein
MRPGNCHRQVPGSGFELPLAAGGDIDVHSALRAMPGGKPRDFASQNRAALYARKLPQAISGARPLVRARGIAAESPQDLHWQIRGLGAESPVAVCRHAPCVFIFIRMCFE